MQPEPSLAAALVLCAEESLSLLKAPRRKCTRIRADGVRHAKRSGLLVKAYRVLFNKFNTLSTASDSVDQLTEWVSWSCRIHKQVSRIVSAALQRRIWPCSTRKNWSAVNSEKWMPVLKIVLTFFTYLICYRVFGSVVVRMLECQSFIQRFKSMLGLKLYFENSASLVPQIWLV